MNNFEDALVALIKKWLADGADYQTIVSTMRIHAEALDEVYKDPDQAELDIG